MAKGDGYRIHLVEKKNSRYKKNISVPVRTFVGEINKVIMENIEEEIQNISIFKFMLMKKKYLNKVLNWLKYKLQKSLEVYLVKRIEND